MNINATMQKALGNQINLEFYSSYLYLAMSLHLEAKGLGGMAAWLRKASQEEQGHAHKLIGFVLERGGQVALEAIKAPPATWKNPLEIFAATHAHEQHVTESIHALAKLAEQENDRATASFLRWFVDEQVEEEAKTSRITDALRLIGDNLVATFLLDKELGSKG